MKLPLTVFVSVLTLLGSTVSAAEKDCDKNCPAPLSVRLRAVAQPITLEPGQRASVASVCLSGETVVGGGPTNIPASLDIIYSTLVFDGRSSGWTVEWKNNGSVVVTETPETGALCVKGTMTSG